MQYIWGNFCQFITDDELSEGMSRDRVAELIGFPGVVYPMGPPVSGAVQEDSEVQVYELHVSETWVCNYRWRGSQNGGWCPYANAVTFDKDGLFSGMYTAERSPTLWFRVQSLIAKWQ